MKANQISLTITRIVLGCMIGAHGVQKLFGWFGGYGYEGTMGFFTDTIGLPYVLGFLIIMAETFGMIALILGLFSRFIAVISVLLMIGAIFTVHLPFGYFMDWNGTMAGEGYELNVALIALSLVIALQGGGVYAVDNILPQILKRKQSISASAA